MKNFSPAITMPVLNNSFIECLTRLSQILTRKGLSLTIVPLCTNSDSLLYALWVRAEWISVNHTSPRTGERAGFQTAESSQENKSVQARHPGELVSFFAGLLLTHLAMPHLCACLAGSRSDVPSCKHEKLLIETTM